MPVLVSNVRFLRFDCHLRVLFRSQSRMVRSALVLALAPVPVSAPAPAPVLVLTLAPTTALALILASTPALVDATGRLFMLLLKRKMTG